MAFDLQEKYLTETESKLGATLPASYREAMMKENGGEISTDEDEWEQYPILDSSDPKRLSRTCNDIISETKSCYGWNGFPAHALAIANNGFGDQLVFLKNGDSYDQTVYFWSHENGEITKIADDFGQLNRI
jgi:hypothetical protein